MEVGSERSVYKWASTLAGEANGRRFFSPSPLVWTRQALPLRCAVAWGLSRGGREGGGAAGMGRRGRLGGHSVDKEEMSPHHIFHIDGSWCSSRLACLPRCPGLEAGEISGIPPGPGAKTRGFWGVDFVAKVQRGWSLGFSGVVAAELA